MNKVLAVSIVRTSHKWPELDLDTWTWLRDHRHLSSEILRSIAITLKIFWTSTNTLISWILDSQFSWFDHLQSSCFQKRSSSLNQVQALRSDLFCFICSLRQHVAPNRMKSDVMDSQLISSIHSQPLTNICRFLDLKTYFKMFTFGPRQSLVFCPHFAWFCIRQGCRWTVELHTNEVMRHRN